MSAQLSANDGTARLPATGYSTVLLLPSIEGCNEAEMLPAQELLTSQRLAMLHHSTPEIPMMALSPVCTHRRLHQSIPSPRGQGQLCTGPARGWRTAQHDL